MRAQPSTTEADWLLERTEALGRLRTALAAGRDGRGALVVVRGPAGVGKSTLLRVTEREARAQGWQVLTARGDDLERGFPFGVAIQLFAEPVRTGAAGPELLAGAAALARPLLEGAMPAIRPGEDPAFPFLHGLHWLTVNLSERAPLLLAVDDVHWADAPTLRFLLYLHQRAEGLPLTLVLTRRTGEPRDPEGTQLLERLEAAAAPVELAGLGLDSVRELVRRRLPEADASFAAACFEASRGNPFLLGELLEEALRAGVADSVRVRGLRPASIRHAILGRLARLGEAAAELARAAALLGPIALEIAAALADLDADAAASAADQLAEARILGASALLAFLHPLLRDAVYAALPPASRRRRHGAAARLLHARGADPATVATHLALCEPLGEAWVVPSLREAARMALGRGDASTALAHLRRALSEPGHDGDPDVLFELGSAERNVGDPAWEKHLETAAATLPDPDRRRSALAALGYGRWVQGDVLGGVAAVQQVLAAIPPGRGGVPEAELLASFYLAARYTPSLVEAVHALLAIERLGPDGAPTPGEAARRALASVDAAMEGRPGSAVALARSVLAWVRDDPALALQLPLLTRAFSGVGLSFAGRYAEAERAFAPVVEDAQRSGNRLGLCALLESRLSARVQRGDARGALADAQIILELSDPWEVASFCTRGLCAELLLERNERQGAIEMLRLPGDVEGKLAPGHTTHFFLPRSRACLALALGQWQEALAQSLLCGERVEAIGAVSPDFQPWRSLAARAAHGLGQRERALALAGEDLQLARRIGSPRATGVALMTLGAIQGDAGAIESLREAVESLDTSEAALEQARARLALGMALRRQGRRREARTLLADAARRARGLGATATAETALAELRVAGGRPRRLEPSGMDSLTPSQLRVAELAAAGRSNKEIAQALFVSLRTIETHLTECYRRLGIGSREQLAAALRPGAADPAAKLVGGPEDRDEARDRLGADPAERKAPPPRLP